MYPPSLVVNLESSYQAYVPIDAPARDVVLMGLRWQTPSWPELALGWLEQGMPVDPEIATCLEQIASRKEWPQRLRHRAQALLRARLRTK
jgi:hypothetical protein